MDKSLKKTIPGGPELKKNTRLVYTVKYEQAVIRDQEGVMSNDTWRSG